MDIVEVFCDIDDFCNQAQEDYQKQFPDQPIPQWSSKLSLSEAMTIIVFFHGSRGFRNFKSFYSMYICSSRMGYADLFPDLAHRFVELMRLTVIPLSYFLKSRPEYWYCIH